MDMKHIAHICRSFFDKYRKYIVFVLIAINSTLGVTLIGGIYSPIINNKFFGGDENSKNIAVTAKNTDVLPFIKTSIDNNSKGIADLSRRIDEIFKSTPTKDFLSSQKSAEQDIQKNKKQEAKPTDESSKNLVDAKKTINEDHNSKDSPISPRSTEQNISKNKGTTEDGLQKTAADNQSAPSVKETKAQPHRLSKGQQKTTKNSPIHESQTEENIALNSATISKEPHQVDEKNHNFNTKKQITTELTTSQQYNLEVFGEP